MSACPSDEEMAAFADGELDEAERSRVHAHVDGCTSCQWLLRELALPSSQAITQAATSLLPTPELVRRSPSTQGYRPGSMVGERYRLDRLLGSGGMGTVWSATHLGTNRQVALKILRADHRATPAARLRFLREARILGRIDHPNLVPVRDVFEDREAPVLAMDLLSGEPLAERLARRGKLTLEEVATLLPGALSAIQVAHDAGVVHRDLKPDNLYIVRAPDGGESLRVLDFGIAKLIDDEDPQAVAITAKGEVLGTPPYMAPEQLRGDAAIDRRVDVWALGVILYECLSGRRPFTGDKFVQFHQRVTSGQRDPLQVAAPYVPRDVVALVEKMLAVDREERCPDLHEAIAVLGRYASGDGAVLREQSARRKSQVTLAAVAALAVAGIGTAAVMSAHRPTTVLAGLGGAPTTLAAIDAGVAAATAPSPATTPSTAPPAPALRSPTECDKEWGPVLSGTLCRTPALAMRESAYRVWRDLRMAAATTDEEKALLAHERKILDWDLNPCAGSERCLLRRLAAASARVGVIDCGRATSDDARQICSDLGLSTLEGTLGAYYRMDRDHYDVFSRRLRRLPSGQMAVIDPKGGAPRPVPTAAQLVQEQNAWLAERRRCGADPACLLKSVEARVAQLKQVHRAFVD